VEVFLFFFCQGFFTRCI